MNGAVNLSLLIVICSLSSVAKPSKLSVEKLINEVRRLKKNQIELEASIPKKFDNLFEKVENLTKQLKKVEENMTSHLKNFESRLGTWTLAFLPSKIKRYIPVCPMKNCFTEKSIRTDIVKSIQQLRNVTNITAKKDCLIIGLNEPRSSAVWFTNSTCILLTEKHPHIELKYSYSYQRRIGKQKLYIKNHVKLGSCSLYFNLKSYIHSRYRMMIRSLTWSEAYKRCQMQGGKLAELTNWEEIKVIGQNYGIKYKDYFTVGASQQAGATAADQGWSWKPSNISIPSDGFVWKLRRPTDKNNTKSVMGAAYFRYRVRFLDLPTKKKHFYHLCECLRF